QCDRKRSKRGQRKTDEVTQRANHAVDRVRLRKAKLYLQRSDFWKDLESVKGKETRGGGKGRMGEGAKEGNGEGREGEGREGEREGGEGGEGGGREGGGGGEGRGGKGRRGEGEKGGRGDDAKGDATMTARGASRATAAESAIINAETGVRRPEPLRVQFC